MQQAGASELSGAWSHLAAELPRRAYRLAGDDENTPASADIPGYREWRNLGLAGTQACNGDQRLRCDGRLAVGR